MTPLKIKKAEFGQPPLNEVVFGVLFNAPGMATAHYGLYWDKIKNEYLNFSEQSPIVLPGKGLLPGEVPFLSPRAWFETKDGKKLIQLQTDRFHYNWRQLTNSDEYRRFESLFPEFQVEWNSFANWIESCAIPVTPSPSSLELTYINHIDSRSGWTSSKDNHRVFNFLGTNQLPPHFSPVTSVANLHFSLGATIGDLYVSLKQGRRLNDNQEILVFELTVRKEYKDDNLKTWFCTAHDAIIDGFLSLTTSEAHKIWGHKESKT